MTAVTRNFPPTSKSGPGIGRPAGTRRGAIEDGMPDMPGQEIASARRPGLHRTPVIAVEGLKKHFPVKKGMLRRTAGHVYPVDGVSFTVHKGDTLGRVG